MVTYLGIHDTIQYLNSKFRLPHCRQWGLDCPTVGSGGYTAPLSATGVRLPHCRQWGLDCPTVGNGG